LRYRANRDFHRVSAYYQGLPVLARTLDNCRGFDFVDCDRDQTPTLSVAPSVEEDSVANALAGSNPVQGSCKQLGSDTAQPPHKTFDHILGSDMRRVSDTGLVKTVLRGTYVEDIAADTGAVHNFGVAVDNLEVVEDNSRDNLAAQS